MLKTDCPFVRSQTAWSAISHVCCCVAAISGMECLFSCQLHDSLPGVHGMTTCKAITLLSHCVVPQAQRDLLSKVTAKL